jgi:hypothetical protein
VVVRGRREPTLNGAGFFHWRARSSRVTLRPSLTSVPERPLAWLPRESGVRASLSPLVLSGERRVDSLCSPSLLTVGRPWPAGMRVPAGLFCFELGRPGNISRSLSAPGRLHCASPISDVLEHMCRSVDWARPNGLVPGESQGPLCFPEGRRAGTAVLWVSAISMGIAPKGTNPMDTLDPPGSSQTQTGSSGWGVPTNPVGEYRPLDYALDGRVFGTAERRQTGRPPQGLVARTARESVGDGAVQ